MMSVNFDSQTNNKRNHNNPKNKNKKNKLKPNKRLLQFHSRLFETGSMTMNTQIY